MVAILVFLLSLFGYSLFFKFIFKGEKIGTLVFLAYSSMVILMYFFLVFSKLRIGAYFVIGLGIILFVVYVIKLKYKLHIKNLVTPVSVFLCLITIALLVFTLKQEVYIHDDFSHWMQAVKQMYYYDEYFVPFSPLYADDYMPAFLPLCYAVCRIFGYSEGVIYIVKSFGLITLLAWFLELVIIKQKDTSKKYLSSIIAMCIFFMFPIFNTYSYGFNTLLVDLDLGAYFGVGIVYTVFYKRRFSKNTFAYYFPIYLCVSCLTLLKEGTGLLFSFIIAISLAMNYFRKFRPNLKRLISDKKYIIALIILPVVISLSWNICYNLSKNTVVQKESHSKSVSLKFKDIVKSPNSKKMSVSYALFQPMDNFKYSIIKSYIKNILKAKNSFSKNKKISLYLASLFILSVYLFFHIPKYYKRKFIRAAVLVSIGAIIFLLGLYIIYVNFIKYCAEEYRYTGTVLVAYLVIISYMCSAFFSYNKKSVRSIIVIYIVLFLLSVNKVQYLEIFYKPNSNKHYFSQNYETARNISSEIDKYINTTDKKIVYISKDQPSLIVYAMEYFSLPKRVRYLNMSWYPNSKMIVDYVMKYDVDYVVIDKDVINNCETLNKYFDKDLNCIDCVQIYEVERKKINKAEDISFKLLRHK